MRLRHAVLALALIVLSAAWMGVAQRSASGGDAAALRALIEQNRKAFEARDVSRIMSSYAPGNQLFVFDAIPPREYPSNEAYRKDWEGLFQAFPGPVQDTVSEIAITVAGPVAYGHHIEDTLFTKPNGQKQRMVVRVTDVYRKRAGRWQIVQEHVSFPVDPNTGKADLLSKP